jgi:hypothetical protein
MDDNGAALQAYKYRLYWEGGLFFFGEMEQDTRAAIPQPGSKGPVSTRCS